METNIKLGKPGTGRNILLVPGDIIFFIENPGTRYKIERLYLKSEEFWMTIEPIDIGTGAYLSGKSDFRLLSLSPYVPWYRDEYCKGCLTPDMCLECQKICGWSESKYALPGDEILWDGTQYTVTGISLDRDNCLVMDVKDHDNYALFLDDPEIKIISRKYVTLRDSDPGPKMKCEKLCVKSLDMCRNCALICIPDELRFL